MASVLAICAVCNRGLVLKLCLQNPEFSFPNLCSNAIDFEVFFRTPFEEYPQVSSDIPSEIPENIRCFFVQGVESYKGGRWDAAGAMFRKTLDVSTKFLLPTAKSKNLFQRIDAMVSSDLLTSSMGDWSHEIRLDGNEAVHDENPETESDALVAMKFTEAFLTYAFTLPALVAANRTKRGLTGVP